MKTISDSALTADSLKRDGVLASPWQNEINVEFQERVSATNQIWGVLIVGGGITGITTAVLLQEAGLSCAVAEARHVGFGTTGGTTAYINTMLDTSYHMLESDFGASGAKLVAEATHQGRNQPPANVDLRYHFTIIVH
ncbi:FAD-dependent oxidoreductase [Parapedobacter deserti]|uniref:FAD-dependent oxidoreductase n=1 Tax=Parapedobacter deserti TaxID=1912957 RepID=A0ABV7JPU1_9SPHI